jgi:cyclic pyranopterin phosphate synthase
MIEERRRKSFEIFNEKGGKFRVSLVNVCNLDCFFCHNEAMPNPRRGEASRELLPAGELLKIISAFTALGGKQVNLTGGEPLAHPDIAGILERIEKRGTTVVLNTNAILADRLLERPRIEKLDSIFASLHTTDEPVFRRSLGGHSVARVMDNIVALKRHGYDVQINFSLGPYNADQFGKVLVFAVEHGIKLKAIALVRPNETPDFYGGRWVDPDWLKQQLAGARVLEEKDAFGGRTTTYALGEALVKIKNIAAGRLMTDFCRGCPHVARCGEGIYGLRVGVDGAWKPCLLRHERFTRVSTEADYAEQILDRIDAMIGDWANARFVTGPPD